MSQPIDLDWEDDAEWWAVRGHVDHDIANQWAWACIDTPEAPRVYVRHTYARWEMHGDRRQLVLHPSQERGCFAVTVAEDAAEVDRVNAWQRRQATEEASARAIVAERWPDAEVVRVDVQVEPHPTRVHVRVPGLVGVAIWLGEAAWLVPSAVEAEWRAWLVAS